MSDDSRVRQILDAMLASERLYAANAAELLQRLDAAERAGMDINSVLRKVVEEFKGKARKGH